MPAAKRVDNKADHFRKCIEIREPQVLAAGDAVLAADRSQQLGLLDRVDAQVRLEVKIQVRTSAG